jgi:predicted RNase H-like nuclease (RuvC/YqgF family)
MGVVMKNKTIEEEHEATQTSSAQLKKEIQILKEENINLEKKTKALQRDNTTLEYEIEWLKLKNKDSQLMVGRFMKSNQMLSKKIKNLNSDIYTLRSQIEKVCELATAKAEDLLNLIDTGLHYGD